mmetsp:Transcript_2986/g.12211  ORF Transcript_2986/g.12211 Transcript_2986/m.12211 type:complete len:265 (+) Transcript_2986:2132-2926(+)
MSSSFASRRALSLLPDSPFLESRPGSAPRAVASTLHRLSAPQSRSVPLAFGTCRTSRRLSRRTISRAPSSAIQAASGPNAGRAASFSSDRARPSPPGRYGPTPRTFAGGPVRPAFGSCPTPLAASHRRLRRRPCLQQCSQPWSPRARPDPTQAPLCQPLPSAPCSRRHSLCPPTTTNRPRCSLPRRSCSQPQQCPRWQAPPRRQWRSTWRGPPSRPCLPGAWQRATSSRQQSRTCPECRPRTRPLGPQWPRWPPPVEATPPWRK